MFVNEIVEREKKRVRWERDGTSLSEAIIETEIDRFPDHHLLSLISQQRE